MHARRSAATAVELWWGHSLGTDCGRVECAKTVLNQPLKQHSASTTSALFAHALQASGSQAARWAQHSTARCTKRRGRVICDTADAAMARAAHAEACSALRRKRSTSSAPHTASLSTSTASTKPASRRVAAAAPSSATPPPVLLYPECTPPLVPIYPACEGTSNNLPRMLPPPVLIYPACTPPFR